MSAVTSWWPSDVFCPTQYVEKLETTFGNGWFHIKSKFLASFENLEEPAALGPPPHMAAICCRWWRLSSFSGHVLASLPRILPLCCRGPVCTNTCPPPACGLPSASAGIWVTNCSAFPSILWSFSLSRRLRHCKPHSVAASRSRTGD